MLITWSDNDTSSLDSEIVIPKYKLSVNKELAKNEIIAANIQDNINNNSVQTNSKYRIINKFDTNPIIQTEPTNNALNNTDSKLSNQNIFISHKNSKKYGLNFN